MIVLRKENDLLNSLIGKSFNQKSKFEAEKILNEIHSKAQDRSIDKKALCFVLDKKEIMGLGGSTLMKDKDGKIISNLILDQFGVWLAGLFSFQSASQRNITIKSTGGINKTVAVYTAGTFFGTLQGGLTVGAKIQVGQGSTSPTRADFTIETPFGTAPESAAFVAPSNPVYNSGLGNFKYSSTINAGGAGTISESILTARWRDIGLTIDNYILFRDIISPSVTFISGQTIALEYTVQL